MMTSKKKHPLISIIIPHFEREKEITIALNSIKKQIYNNWECIIVDDGSKENTIENIETILKDQECKNISLIKRPINRLKGANSCRNIGIEKARGSYIALLDSDDSWPENYLSNCLNFALKIKNFCASYSGAIIYRNNITKLVKSRQILDQELFFDFLLSPGVLAQTSSYFIKKGIANEIKFDENLKRHQDYDFFIRLGKRYKWHHNPSTFTKINWTTIDNRIPDFNSCIKVYEKYKSEFSNKKLKEKYLMCYYSLSIKKNAKNNIIEYYQKELKQNGYTKKKGIIFMVWFPYLYRYYKRKSTLLINIFNDKKI